MKTKTLKFKQKSSLAWIIYNLFRFIPIILFSWIFYIYYFIKYLIKRNTVDYKTRSKQWDNACKDEKSLQIFFTNIYKYKYDFLGGFMDHDSSIYEWILGYGDCDDMALYSKRALKQLGKESYRIGIMWFPKKNLPILHFDCLTITRDENNCIKTAKLFNYGNIIKSTSIDEALYILTEKFTKNRNTKTKVCVCIY